MVGLLSSIPYWGQSLLRVLGGIVAVLLPAGTIVYADVRGKRLPMTVTAMPFAPHRYMR